MQEDVVLQEEKIVGDESEEEPTTADGFDPNGVSEKDGEEIGYGGDNQERKSKSANGEGTGRGIESADVDECTADNPTDEERPTIFNDGFPPVGLKAKPDGQTAAEEREEDIGEHADGCEHPLSTFNIVRDHELAAGFCFWFGGKMMGCSFSVI